MNSDHSQNEHRITLWQLVILFLSIYVLGALFIDTVFRLPPETSELLTIIDNLICIIFIGDFFFNLFTARNKVAFLKWGWIDLVSSIPNIQVLRWGRFVRAVRVFRILRAFRSTKRILQFVFENPAKGTFLSVTATFFVIMIFSSIAILNIETLPESNIKSASDALWWSFVTITTVGYGDRYPVTGLGRIIAGVLMVIGVGLFGTFTAYIASLFIKPPSEKDAKKDTVVLEKISELGQRIDCLEQKITSIKPHEEKRPCPP
ncbi:MAG: ion transporter [Candidatus Sumerlaeia bacterium]|nr:ion transporter [Candidatus Sumerlaeia bacterium]